LLVKDNTDYIIRHDIIVDLPNENSSITIRASGYEHEGSSANDVLLPAEHAHTSIDDWSIGATGSLFGSNDDFEYELRYTMGSSALTNAFYQQLDWRWCSKC
jgi:hypothetical protein